MSTTPDDPEMRPRRHEAGSRVLLVVAALAAVVAIATGYVRWTGGDADRFADRATAALRDDAVRALVAERVTDGLVSGRGADLIAARPVIASATEAVVGSRAFTRVFRDAVRDLHAALVGGDAETLTVVVRDVGIIVAAALERVRPALVDEVRAAERVALLTEDLGAAGARVAALVHASAVVAWLASALALVAALGSVALARDRRGRVVHLGVAALVAGTTLVVVWGVARSLLLGRVEDPDARAAAAAVWDAFLGDLRLGAWVLAGSGAVVAAAAASLIRPVDLATPARRALTALATEPRGRVLRVARAAGVVVAGVVVLVARDAVLDAALTLLGLLLLYVGVGSLLRLVDAPRRAGTAGSPSGVRRRTLTAAAVAAVPVLAATVLVAATARPDLADTAGEGCNGSPALCDRTLEQVTLPATHNSMSAPLPGWFRAEQDRPIPDQLRDGIRGLLIDTWYADRLRNGRLRTDLGDVADIRERAAADGVDPDAVEAALRIRDRAGFGGAGTRGVYLCHGFCEVGGTPFGQVLREVRDFLVVNPGEVLVVINQDAVAPEDVVAEVRDAGLEPFVYRGPTEPGRWPTLGEMVERDERLVILAEERAGAAPWYRTAYDGPVQETPYLFTRTGQLTRPDGVAASCVPNRGTADAPLFLVNHWVTTPVPRPSAAAEVNAYDVLLRRARACARIRGRTPTLLAVDFYRRGDLFRVVDTLNGTG